MYVHQTAAGNVVAGLRAKDAWAIKKFGRGYTVQFVWNVEHTTQHTAHYTQRTFFVNDNASLGEYAGIFIEVQYEHTDRGGDVMTDDM